MVLPHTSCGVSVHRGGALMIEGAEGVSVAGCEFVRLGGNAIALSGHAWHTSITHSEIVKIGDSAIVSVHQNCR